MSGHDQDTARVLADAREALTRLAAEAHSLAEAAQKAERALSETAGRGMEDEPPPGEPGESEESGPPAAEQSGEKADRGPGTGLARGDLDDAEASLAAGAGEAAGSSPAPAAAAADAVEPVGAAPGDGPEGRPNVDRARLSALNLALRGVPRDEAERRLAERFEVEGLDEILAEAYERAERAE